VPFYGINPTKTEACGVTCYPTHGRLPAVPEMVVMGVGHGRIEAAIDDVPSVDGVRAIITPGLGNEAGREGPRLERIVSRTVRDAGIAMVGPNCMGVATPGSRRRGSGACTRRSWRARSRRSPTPGRSARSWCRSARGSASAPWSRQATRR
jgi:hypothetical protein